MALHFTAKAYAYKSVTRSTEHRDCKSNPPKGKGTKTLLRGVGIVDRYLVQFFLVLVRLAAHLENGERQAARYLQHRHLVQRLHQGRVRAAFARFSQALSHGGRE